MTRLLMALLLGSTFALAAPSASAQVTVVPTTYVDGNGVVTTTYNTTPVYWSSPVVGNTYTSNYVWPGTWSGNRYVVPSTSYYYGNQAYSYGNQAISTWNGYQSYGYPYYSGYGTSFYNNRVSNIVGTVNTARGFFRRWR